MKQTIRLNENQLNNLIKNAVQESVKRVLNESFNKSIMQDDLRNFFEINKNYDGSVSMANARYRMLSACCGDLPWGINEQSFINMIYNLPGSWSIDSLTKYALQWVEDRISDVKSPKFY